jgi:hypothetical protein
MLAIDRDRPASEAGKIDTVPAAAEAQLDAIVHEPFSSQSGTDTGIVEHIDRALLEQASANPPFDIGTRAIFQDNGIDALQRQEMRQQEPSGSCADDPDLCAQSDLP